MARFCPTKGNHILNPIIDWTDEDVWEFVRNYKVDYCCLYDEGYTRLGCIGCPMSTRAEQDLEIYPKYKAAYIRAFRRMINKRREDGLETEWKTGEEVMKWWLKK